MMPSEWRGAGGVHGTDPALLFHRGRSLERQNNQGGKSSGSSLWLQKTTSIGCFLFFRKNTYAYNSLFLKLNLKVQIHSSILAILAIATIWQPLGIFFFKNPEHVDQHQKKSFHWPQTNRHLQTQCWLRRCCLALDVQEQPEQLPLLSLKTRKDLCETPSL